MRKKANLLLIISTILVIAMVLIIFTFSNQTGGISVGKSQDIVDTLIQKLGIQKYLESNEWLYENRNYIFRKVLHFTEYAILASLMFITLRLREIRLKQISIITLLFVCIVAAADEYYQSHIPGRSPQIIDVIIDTSGAFIAVITILFNIKLFRRFKVIPRK